MKSIRTTITWDALYSEAGKPYSRFCFFRHLSRQSITIDGCDCRTSFPCLGTAAATGTDCACARADPTRLAPSWTFTQPLQLPATLVGFSHRFSHHHVLAHMIGLLSVAVVVTQQLLAARPHLLFREATLPFIRAKSQESGSSSRPRSGRATDRLLATYNRVSRQGIEP